MYFHALHHNIISSFCLIFHNANLSSCWTLCRVIPITLAVSSCVLNLILPKKLPSAEILGSPGFSLHLAIRRFLAAVVE